MQDRCFKKMRSCAERCAAISRSQCRSTTPTERRIAMSASTVFDGLTALSAAVQKQPSMVITFYDYGIIMRRAVQGGGYTEYAISPAQLATALAARVSFETGLLLVKRLYVASEGIKKLVAEYPEPQRTAL